MKFLLGLVLGSSLTVAGLAFVFFTTTTHYRSTLFEGQAVRINKAVLQ